MARKAASKEDLRTRLAELSGWQTATRDDAAVAEGLQQTRSMDQIYPLNEAAFFDELFHYLREIGAWQLLEALDPEARAGALYPFIQFVLFTIMRCVGGVQSMLATRELLLTDEALMGVLGFNAAQVQQGSNDRGVSRRTKPVAIRGAFSFETVADNIVQIGPARLAALFNGAIRCLARQGMFPKQIDAVLDATDDEATPRYQTDDGRAVPRVSRAKRPDVRANQHAQKIKVTVFGWKLWLVFEPVSKIPLAMAIDGINVSDNEHACAVLAQARANVEGYATIRSVALDRGFLDGKLLARIDRAAVVYIPAKANMTITADAREIARRAEGLATQGKRLDGCTYQERVERVTRGSGKQATVEERRTTVVRIRDLPCDWWTLEGSTSAANAKGFEPKRVNATVVLRWDGAPKDAETEVVILDTDPAADPFVGFDAYDDRSLIENTCHREAKESWFLEHHPKRSEAGVRVHAYFVFLCMALVTAFRLYRQHSEAAESRGEETGIGRFRRQLKVANRDKVIVFCGEHFGIFRNFEVVMLLGGLVRDRALMGESAQTVLERCRPRKRDPAWRPASRESLSMRRYCGRDFSAPDLACVRRITEEDPGRTRWAISRLVCEALAWRKPDGGLKEMSCRVALLRMQRDGLVRLPAPRRRGRGGKLRTHRTPRAEPEAPLTVPAGELPDLRLELVTTRRESRLWNEYVDRYHYLGYRPLPGAQLRYFARSADRCVALFGFGAAAWKTAPRDRFIGWTPQQRAQRLHLVVNNARFLILPWITSRHLASKLLGLVARRLVDDWFGRYAYRPVLIETFVEKPRFAGTCYRAANWLCLGDTRGRGKLDTAHAHALPLKSVWVFPLSPRFRQILTG